MYVCMYVCMCIYIYIYIYIRDLAQFPFGEGYLAWALVM